MASIFSTISGQFSKSLILGAFAPAAAFVILGLILIDPLLPTDWAWLNALAGLDLQTKIIVITLATIVLSLLLFNLNSPIIRFYEGYPWKDTGIGSWLKGRYQTRFKSLQARDRALDKLWGELEDQKAKTPQLAQQLDAQISKIQTESGKIGLALNSEYPDRDDLILPTRLGNLMRSYECYPEVQYGMSAIPLWPRLIAVVKSDYAASIDDAKTSLDFMLNSSMLSALFALLILTLGLAHPLPLASLQAFLVWGLEIVGFAAASFMFYQWALSRARARGDLVKGAFDLYRGDLLKQLGFTRTPATKKDERELWSEISQQMIFGDSLVRGPRIDYAEATPPPAQGTPDDARLELARGIERSWIDPRIIVVLQVTNKDRQKREVTDVVVTDTVPSGYYYEWDSARVGNDPVPVSGENPYHFALGKLVLKPGQTAICKYRMVPG